MSFHLNIQTCTQCDNVLKNPNHVWTCSVGGKPIGDHAKAHDCPRDLYKARGLGDRVAKAIKTVSFGLVKPCGGCKGRQAALNQAFPSSE